MPGKIAPSMMCMRLEDMVEGLKTFEKEGIEYLHIDVMDGHFVPNMQLGVDYAKNLRALTNIPLDIHLMIENPDEKIRWFDPQPGEYVAVHYETTKHVQRVLASIRATGAKAMLALNPATPLCVLEEVLPDLDAVLIMTVNPGFAGQKMVPQSLEKIRRCKEMLVSRGYDNVEIEVDGNVSFENAVKMRAAGADIFVGGSSGIFVKGMTFEESIAKFRGCIE